MRWKALGQQIKTCEHSKKGIGNDNLKEISNILTLWQQSLVLLYIEGCSGIFKQDQESVHCIKGMLIEEFYHYSTLSIIVFNGDH